VAGTWSRREDSRRPLKANCLPRKKKQSFLLRKAERGARGEAARTRGSSSSSGRKEGGKNINTSSLIENRNFILARQKRGIERRSADIRERNAQGSSVEVQ